jgi:hypothetical protein
MALAEMIRKDYGSEGHDKNDVYEVEVSIVAFRITIRIVGLLCFCPIWGTKRIRY